MQGVELMRGGCQAGFSLMEMVVVILLLGVLGASFGLFIVPMVKGYNAVAQRAALVDTAESALRRMARDIRISVPNSVRVATPAGGGFALEMVPTVDGGRFCAAGLIDCGSLAGGLAPTTRQVLDVNNTDAEFDIVGCFQDATFRTVSNSDAYRLVIGNSGTEVYAASGSPMVITPFDTTITVTTDPSGGTCGSGGARHHVTLSSSHKFCPDASADSCNARTPRQRVFVVTEDDAPVSYVCDQTAKTLTRYWKYTFAASQPTGQPAGSQKALLANGVNACSIASPSLIPNTGIVVISLTLQDGAGETVTLMHQSQIDNSQ
jgi:MSHA biogenesis protein MshO